MKWYDVNNINRFFENENEEYGVVLKKEKTFHELKINETCHYDKVVVTYFVNLRSIAKMFGIVKEGNIFSEEKRVNIFHKGDLINLDIPYEVTVATYFYEYNKNLFVESEDELVF